MAARVIAQVIMQFTAVASRAFVSAYQQALQNAKAGGGGAAAANIGNALKNKMKSDEALKVLNIDRSALNATVLEQQYSKYFASNDPKKGGSFYLQSKVYRAKEALDLELNPKPQDKEEPSHSETKEESPVAGKSGSAGASSSSSSSSSRSNGNGGESDEARARRERFEKFRRGGASK